MQDFSKKTSWTKNQLKHTNFAALWLERKNPSLRTLSELEEEIRKIHRHHELSPSEKLAEIVFKLHSELHGQRSFSARWSHPLVDHPFIKGSTLDQLNHKALRSVPLRAQRALLKWAKGEYPIVLLEYIPTPWELFLLQTEGKRALSLILSENFLSQQFEERNYFEFLLHDLIHADHFFEDKERMQTQIGFCRLLKKAHSLNFLTFLTDEKFQSDHQTDFNYLISDMNSHSLHLALTLKSLLCRYWKDENKFNSWWTDLITRLGHPELAPLLIEEYRDERSQPLVDFFKSLN